MKAMALAVLIPVAICTACGTKEESVATATAPVEQTIGAAAEPATEPALSTGAVPAPATANEPAPPFAHVRLTSVAGSTVMGDLTLVNQGGAVSIRGEITGLAPGKEHGFHIHEVGNCSLPDFKSAGEHFNPTNDPHGGPKSATRHLGDLPNAKADKDGRARIDVSVKGVTFVDKDGAPTEILGKALVVHSQPDDYKSQPAGDSGDRIACGVIR